ncbi:uncharacterized protein [Haliotis asinina]|uniref:uncharacterized protein n=1 Tax=Haliotis asinina TaxID=109174 RepID=UPI0035324ADB
MKDEEKSGMCEAGTQTDLTMSDIHIMNEDLKSKTEKLDDKETLFRDLFLETVVKDDEHVRFYTGLPSCAVLLGIFNILVSKCSVLNYWNGNAAACKITNTSRCHPGPSRKLTVYQEFILTLVRLRQGFLQYFSADVFGISKSRVSQIFATWITFMSQTFDNVLKWPSKLQVKKYMPLSFKQVYPRTRAIIDCTEFFFQKPRSPSAQAATYSLYKSKNTGKCLLAISPSGTFTFVSDLYGGNASDRYITENSGFLDLIEPGDDITADRGFNVRDLLTRKRATLNMPPYS